MKSQIEVKIMLANASSGMLKKGTNTPIFEEGDGNTLVRRRKEYKATLTECEANQML